MMDYTDLDEWGQRIPNDERERDKHLLAYSSLVQGYHGQAYESSDRAGTPENFYLAYITSTVPWLVERNPVFSVNSGLSGSDDSMSVPMRHGLNQWVKDSSLVETLLPMATKFCMTWAVAMVTHEPDLSQGRIEDRPLFKNGKLRSGRQNKKPKIYDLDPMLYGVDSRALSMDQTEYQFNRWFERSENILAEAEEEGSGWNIEAVRALGEGTATSRDGASYIDPARESGGHAGSMCNQLSFISIWVPGLETDNKGPDQGYNGSIITLCDNSSGSANKDGKFTMVKDTEPYFGPPSGPYQVFGAYSVPGKLWPLGHLTANYENIEELNATSRGINKANNEGKNALLYDLLMQEDMERLNDADSGSMVGLEGFNKESFAAFSFGFATQQQYIAQAGLRSTFQSISGMSDASQGNVSGVGTATENQIAAGVTTRRNEYLYDQFSGAVVKCAEKVAHWLHWDNDIEFPLGSDFFDAEKELGFEPGSSAVFKGGHPKGEEKYRLAKYELKIDMYSMGRPDRVQLNKSILQADRYLLETLQLRSMAPWVNWQVWDEMHSVALGIPELKSLVDNAAAAQQQPWQDGGEIQKARFSGDKHPRGQPGGPRVSMDRPDVPQPQPTAPPIGQVEGAAQPQGVMA